MLQCCLKRVRNPVLVPIRLYNSDHRISIYEENERQSYVKRAPRRRNNRRIDRQDMNRIYGKELKSGRLHARLGALDKESMKVAKEIGPLRLVTESPWVNNFNADAQGNLQYAMMNLLSMDFYKNNPELKGYIRRILTKVEKYEVITTQDYFNIRNFVGTHDTQKRGLYYEFLLNLVIYMVEQPGQGQPKIDPMVFEDIAQYFYEFKLKMRMRNLINYNIILEKLSKLNYFEGLTPKQIYQIAYKPLITPLNREEYLFKLNNLKNAMNFVDHQKNYSYVEYSTLTALLKPDLLQTLHMAISMCDDEMVTELWNYYKNTYDFLLPEDYHNLKSVAIEFGNYNLLDDILNNWKFVTKRPEPSLTELKAISQIYHKNKQVDKFLKIKKIINTHSKEKPNALDYSLLVESLSDNLTTMEVLKLIDGGIGIGDALVVRDYLFLKKRFFAKIDDPKLTFIDIENSLDETILESTDLSDEVKTLYINLYIAALSDRTNITGVAHGYCQLPLEYANIDTFRILFHTLSVEPMKYARLTHALYKFAVTTKGIEFGEREYEILLSNSIDLIHDTKRTGLDIDQLCYYLYQYLRKFEVDDFSRRIFKILSKEPIRKRQNNVDLTEEPRVYAYRDSKMFMSLFLLSYRKKYSRSAREIIENTIELLMQRNIGIEAMRDIDYIEDYYYNNHQPFAGYPTQMYDHIAAKKVILKHELYEQSKRGEELDYEKLDKIENQLDEDFEKLIARETKKMEERYSEYHEKQARLAKKDQKLMESYEKTREQVMRTGSSNGVQDHNDKYNQRQTRESDDGNDVEFEDDEFDHGMDYRISEDSWNGIAQENNRQKQEDIIGGKKLKPTLYD